MALAGWLFGNLFKPLAILCARRPDPTGQARALGQTPVANRRLPDFLRQKAGMPDAPSGEAVKAFIVRGDPALDAEAVRGFCRRELANCKVPKFVEFRDDLPKSNVGKILRKDLREEVLREKGRGSHIITGRIAGSGDNKTVIFVTQFFAVAYNPS